MFAYVVTVIFILLNNVKENKESTFMSVEKQKKNSRFVQFINK